MCGDLDVEEYDGKAAEVDFKRAVDCLRKQNARCTVKECVSVGSTVRAHALHCLQATQEWQCTAATLLPAVGHPPGIYIYTQVATTGLGVYPQTRSSIG